MENQTEHQSSEPTIIVQAMQKPSNGIGLAGFILSLLPWGILLLISLSIKTIQNTNIDYWIDLYLNDRNQLYSYGQIIEYEVYIGILSYILSVIFSFIGLFKKPQVFALLGLFISLLPFVLVIIEQISTPIRFDRELTIRKTAVIERISDIRTAERAFRLKYHQFTDNFDVLEWFILNDSLELDNATSKVAVIDTIFSPRKLTPAQVKELRYIPYGNGQEYYLEAGIITTESKVVIPIVECRAPYKTFIDTETYRQELINLIDDEENNFNRYAGVKFGSMEGGNNEAGNWED